MCALDPSSDLVIAGALCTWLVLEGRLEEIAHMPFRLLRYSQFMPPGTNKGKKWTFENPLLKSDSENVKQCMETQSNSVFLIQGNA